MATSFDRSKYTNVTKVVVLSGKRKSGKDYVGEKLADTLNAILLHLSEPLKREFAEFHRINGDALMDSSAYKENYRRDIIK